jgi:hypothetical protein
MDLATVDNLSAQSNIANSGPSRIAQGLLWGGLSVAVLSGWFVVTRVGLRRDLRVWDVIALRFGEGALLLTPALLIGPLIIALGVGLAAASSNQADSNKGESQ